MVQKLPLLRRCFRFAAATSLACAGLATVGCGPELSPVPVEFSTPSALVIGCANPPAELAAELWISGFDESCALDVDLAAGTTTGSCVVTTGRDRTITVDWFIIRGGNRVLLAQTRQSVALANVTEDTVDVTVGDADIELLACLDVRDDQLNGSETQLFDGQERLVCDLDDSCGGTLDIDCSNIGEVCAGGDPLVP